MYVKRLKRESEKWNDNISLMDKDKVFVVIENPEENIFLELVINICENYPFHVPTVTKYNINILNYFNTNFEDDYTKITDNSCICCSSILCENNWSCANNVQDIVDEINKLINIKRRLQERFLCKRIQELYFHQIPIHEYL